MASLHPNEHYNHNYNGNVAYSSHPVVPETEKMLTNTNDVREPGGISDGLEVHEGVDYSTAPQHHPGSAQQPYYDYAQPPQTTQYAQTAYANNDHHNAVAPPPEKRDNGVGAGNEGGKLFGFRKPTFLLVVISIILFVALVAVAGALGAMIAQKDSQLADLSASLAAASSSAAAAPPPSSTATAEAAFDISKPAPSDSPVSTNKCPGSSELTWTLPGTDVTFSKECGTDYVYGDIDMIHTKNIEECLRLCAALNANPQTEIGSCKGVVFFNKKPDGSNDKSCFMKYTQNRNSMQAKDMAESAWII